LGTTLAGLSTTISASGTVLAVTKVIAPPLLQSNLLQTWFSSRRPCQ
jgi:hypothetical protein